MELKKDLEILENGIKAYCEQIGLTYTDTYGCNVERLKKALEELETIKSADGGEAMEALEELVIQFDKEVVYQDEINGLAKTLKNFILKAQAQAKEFEKQVDKAELGGIIMTVDYMFENMVDHVSIEEVIKSVGLSLSEVESQSENMFDCLERWREHSYWGTIKRALEDNEK